MKIKKIIEVRSFRTNMILKSEYLTLLYIFKLHFARQYPTIYN